MSCVHYYFVLLTHRHDTRVTHCGVGGVESSVGSWLAFRARSEWPLR